MKKKVLVGILSLTIVICSVAVGWHSLNSKTPESDDKKASQFKADVNYAGTQENEKAVINANYYLDFPVDYSKAENLTKDFEYIAIIRVDSVDGVTNWNSKSKEYVSPYTYGKATVLATIKGKIDNDTIGFIRLGGTLPFEQWIKGDEAPEKMEKIREEAGLKAVKASDILVESKMLEDIEIEAGKEYLVFLSHDSQYNNENEYSICAMQYGLREIENVGAIKNSLAADKNEAVKSLMVKNNVNGKWESIKDVVTVLSDR